MENKTYIVERHIMFYASGEEVTHGRLKIFFTDEAIYRFVRDGFIKVINPL